MNEEEQALFLTLYYLDDTSLLKACQVNKKFYRKICDNIWLGRIKKGLGLSREDVDSHKGNKTYGQYYSEMLNEVAGDKNWKNHLLRSNSQQGHHILVKALLHLGADPDNNEGYSLKAASDQGHGEVVKVLLEGGANPNLGDGPDQPLGLASKKGHIEIVEMLLKYGAKSMDISSVL